MVRVNAASAEYQTARSGRRQGPGHLKEDFRLPVLPDTHLLSTLVWLHTTPSRIVMR